jgi:hypothetical protein
MTGRLPTAELQEKYGILSAEGTLPCARRQDKNVRSTECGLPAKPEPRKPGGYQWWVCTKGHMVRADQMAIRRLGSNSRGNSPDVENEIGPEWPDYTKGVLQ